MILLLTSDTHYGYSGKTHSKHDKLWKRIAELTKDHKVGALIWAGDLASNKQRQFERTIEHAREHIDIPIALVRGNHDWWDAADRDDKAAGWRSFQRLDELHQEIFKKYNIHHLENGPLFLGDNNDVAICGWDGWYGNGNPPSNDQNFMFKDVEGCPTHVFMSNRAWRKFDEVMALDLAKYETKIAVTHFNPYVNDVRWEKMCANLKFYDMIKEKFDIFCCGHNHQVKDRKENGCRIFNSGSDYDQPKYTIFDTLSSFKEETECG